MTGFVPVDIPTKKYIKAYIISKLGQQPQMVTNGDSIGHKLHDLLRHETNERATVFQSIHYSTQVRIYIPVNTFKKRGAFLNETNTKNFNIYVEKELKDKFYACMDILIMLFPSFENNLPEVRKRIGIDIESWSDDSMKKDYYRYRKRTGKELFYNKTFSQNVPRHAW